MGNNLVQKSNGIKIPLYQSQSMQNILTVDSSFAKLCLINTVAKVSAEYFNILLPSANTDPPTVK